MDELSLEEDPERRSQLQAELREIEEQIRKMFKAEVSMGEINRRNLDRNKEDIAEIGLREAKEREEREAGGAGAVVRDADPFSRRPTRVQNYFKMSKPKEARCGLRLCALKLCAAEGEGSCVAALWSFCVFGWNRSALGRVRSGSLLLAAPPRTHSTPLLSGAR